MRSRVTFFIFILLLFNLQASTRSVLAEGSVPVLAEGSVPVLAEGSVPVLAEGSVPVLAEGSVPVLAEGSVPVLAEGSVPVLAEGSVPVLAVGSVPVLAVGSVPVLAVGSVPANLGKGPLHILQADETHVVLELTLPDFESTPLTYQGVTYQQLHLVDPRGAPLHLGYWGQPGYPQLPMVSVLLGMPILGTPQVTVLAAEYHTLRPGLLAPAPTLAPGPSTGSGQVPSTGSGQVPLTSSGQVPATGTSDTDPSASTGRDSEDKIRIERFDRDPQAYARDTFYPGAHAKATAIGLMRDQPLFQLRLYPFLYNPAQQTLRVCHRLRVRVDFPQSTDPSASTGTDPSASTGTDPSASTGKAPSVPRRAESAAPFEQLLEQTLLNYASLPRTTDPSASTGTDPSASAGTADPTHPAPLPRDTRDRDDGPQVKLYVEQNDLYRVTYEDLVGVAPTLLLADPRRLELTHQGDAVAILFSGEQDGRFDPGDGFIFYGQAIDSDYTRQNVYWLSQGDGPGLRMNQRDGTPGAGDTPTAFTDQRHYEQDEIHWRNMPDGQDKDHWFWDQLQADSSTPVSVDYAFTLRHIATDGTGGALRVMLHGATFEGHQTQLYLNDTALLPSDEQSWEGKVEKLYTVSVPQSLFTEGINYLRVENARPEDQSSSRIYINWFKATYQDTFVAEDDRLSFSAPAAGGHTFELRGFTQNTLLLLDLADPARPVQITHTAVESDGDGYLLRFTDDNIANQPYLVQQVNHLPPPGLQLDDPSTWKSPTNGATYLIVTHPDFYDAVQPLATHRASQGERVSIVKTEDIYDEFNGGLYGPEAIHDFLKYTYAHWSPQPLYVLLVGDASLDPKNNRGSSLPDLLPAYYVDIVMFGQAPNDSWYAKVYGDDDYPDLLIGRITARYVSDVSTMVNKVQTYEQSPPAGDWMRQAVLVADDGDTRFTEDMDTVADLLPNSVTPTKMYRYAGTSVQSAVSDGALLFAYSGHGNVTGLFWGTWSGGYRIFDLSQMRGLWNGNKLPFMTVANCNNGLFDQYDNAWTMSEDFVRLSNRGGIASWAPVNYTFPTVNQVISEELYRSLLADKNWTLGSAVTAARIQAHARRPDLPLSLFEAFTYFGDPAVRLNMPATLALTGHTTPNPVVMGEWLTYTLSYAVSEADQARGLTLVNTLPDGVRYHSASRAPSSVYAQTLTWELGDTPAGSATIVVTARVGTISLSHGQTLRNQARLYDANGGQENVRLTTTAHDAPITDLSASNDGPTELGTPTSLSAEVMAGTNVVYTWNFGDGSSPQSGASVQHVYPAVGTYTARVTAANGVSSASQTSTVYIGDVPPVASLDTSSPDLLGQATTFHSTSSGTNLTFEWDFGDGSAPVSGPSPDVGHVYDQPGEYTVQLAISNSAGSDTTQGTVEILEAPIANFDSDSPTELGQITHFTNNSQGGGDNPAHVHYDWDLGDGSTLHTTGETSGNEQHVYPATGIYTVSLTARNRVANDTYQETIYVTDVPIQGLSASNNSPTLLGSPTALTAAITRGSNVLYTWDPGDGSAPQTGAAIQHTYPAVGAYTAQVTATNSVSSQIQTTTITIADVPPVARFTSSSPDKLGQTTTMESHSDGTNLSYEWDFGDGSVPLRTADPTVTHVYTAVNTYTVALTASNSAGRSSISNTVKIVTNVYPPVARFTSNTPGTFGQKTTFTNASEDGGDEAENVTFAWDFGDGNISATRHPTHTYATLGTFSVSLTISNSVSSDSYNDAIMIVDQPIAGLSIAHDGPTTLGQTTHFSATVDAGTHVSYTWDLGDGTLGSASYPTHTYEAIGAYTVTLTATNSAGHQVTRTAVTVVDEPVTGLQLSHDGPTPLGATTGFNAAIDTGTHVTYAWDLGDGTLILRPAQALRTSPQLTHTYDTVGIYTAILTATNSRGAQTVTDTVLIHDVPIHGLSIRHDGPTPIGYPTSLTASVAQGTHVTYRWDLGDGTVRSAQSLLHTYLTTGTYSVTLTASNGWNSQTTTQAITVYQPDEPIQGLNIANNGPTFLGDATHLILSMTAGTNVSLLWDFGDGNTSTVRNPTHTFAAVGEYTVILTATNSWGNLVRYDAVTIRDVPVSGLSLSHNGPTMLGNPSMLSASVTGGTSVMYNWDLGDGQTGTGAQLTHTYAAPGIYPITVTALNGTNEEEALGTVTVLDPSNTWFLPLIYKR